MLLMQPRNGSAERQADPWMQTGVFGHLALESDDRVHRILGVVIPALDRGDAEPK
jgi:hypothetical protein